METQHPERRSPQTNHLPEHTQTLFLDIMTQLSKRGDPYRAVPELLRDVSQYFRFGCGFIYESDHAGVFHRTEFYSPYGLEMPGSFKLFQEFSAAQLGLLAKKRSIVLHPDRKPDEVDKKMLGLFLLPLQILHLIWDSDGKLIGLIGLADRREGNNLSQTEYQVAKSVLAVIGNQVKLHIYQNTIETTKSALTNMLDHMGIDIYVNDFNTHEVLFANESMAAPYGGKEALIGKVCYQALYDDKVEECDYCPQHKLLDDKGNPNKLFSWDYQRPRDKKWFRVFSSAFPWVDGRLAHVVSSVDITQSKQNEETIRQMAEYDALTGLPNRRKLIKDINICLGGRQAGFSGYVLFFDLDSFKRVNDELGHRTGDELLVRIGQKLQSHPFTKDHAYRHGGDEFVLTYQNVAPQEIIQVIEHIQQTFGCLWHLQDADVSTPASIGIACCPTDGKTAEELIHNADQAMYVSKRKGKGLAHFYNQGETLTLEEFKKSLKQQHNL